MAFDPALAEQVVAELGDHLAEAQEAKSVTIDPLTLFGPAANFAQACAAAQEPRRLGHFLRLLITALLLVILTMRLRLALLPTLALEGWLLLAHWADRYGLLVALVALAVAGWGLWRRRRHFWPYSLRRWAAGAFAALALSCAGGLGLTLAAWQAAPAWPAVAPLATTLAEAVALVMLASEYRRLRHYPEPISVTGG